ncbi:hypothetical protein CY35_07G026100 [Sphagnum magellanicum]|uniref:Uncharacterized protein n=1 Tax=Sphagnum magellanicum TaxID=128215 RepID=A0ACB8HJK7_9BRYO|nr:hypothetical protein CY35_07G026100 [Sphagnum magellanicum]
MRRKKKFGSSWTALKKQVQQCSCMGTATFEDTEDTTQVSTTGQSRLDAQAAAMASSSQCARQCSTYNSIFEYVDEEQLQEDRDAVCKVLPLKLHRHRSLAEELELPNASPDLRLPCNVAPGAAAAPCPAASGLQHSGAAAFKHVHRSSGAPAAVRKQLGLIAARAAGAELADCCDTTAVGRSHGCRGVAVGKLSESVARRRSRGHAKLEKSEARGREECATGSRTDSSSSSQAGRLIFRSWVGKDLELQQQQPSSTRTASTRMSRTEYPRTARRIPRKLHPARPPARVSAGMKHAGWNASTRSAQDCQALIRDKERALMKRERALKYAHSIRRYYNCSRHGSAARRKLGLGAAAGEQLWPISKEAARTPDKPGWVWSWLERAARMGGVTNHGPHRGDNRVFDNDSSYSRNVPAGSRSQSSVQSTIAMCTTGAADSRAAAGPDSLRHSWTATTSSSASELDLQSPGSMSKFKYSRLYSTRRLAFWKKQVFAGGLQMNCKQDYYDKRVEKDMNLAAVEDESVGSCAAAATTPPVAAAAAAAGRRAPPSLSAAASKYKLCSHFSTSGGHGAQTRVLKSSSQCAAAAAVAATQLKLLKSSPKMSGRRRADWNHIATITRAAGDDGDVVVEDDDDVDSVASTATSLRKKKFRKPV